MAPLAGGTVDAPGLLPGGHGGWKFCADEGVVVVVPGAAAVAGLVELAGAVCGLFLAVLPVFGAAVGFAAVLLRVPVFGVAAFAAAVPVPTPAGTHGIVVGD